MVFVDKMCIDNMEQVLHKALVYNHNFLSHIRHIYMHTLHDKGIRIIKDIIIQQGDFVDVSYIEQVTCRQVNILQYHSLIHTPNVYKQKHNIFIYIVYKCECCKNACLYMYIHIYCKV